MSSKKPAEEPKAEAEEKPKAAREPTEAEIQAQAAKAEEAKEAKAVEEQNKMRKFIAGNMSFAASMAGAYKICKEAGMTSLDTDMKMKGIIEPLVRSTFGWPELVPLRPPAQPAPPQAPAQPPYQPPAQPPQQPATPYRR